MKYWKWMQATALCAVGALAFTACDNYDRTEVDYAIFVNQQSVTMFVGEQTQLVASPADGGTFNWYTDQVQFHYELNGKVYHGHADGGTLADLFNNTNITLTPEN